MFYIIVIDILEFSVFFLSFSNISIEEKFVEMLKLIFPL